MLEIKDLRVEVDGKTILDGLDLSVGSGEVHAIMGPNGSGKSTLAYVLAGKPEYKVTGGGILYDGEDLLQMEPDKRAAAGVFLAFQYPVEIPGVGTMTFLRTALNAQRKARGEPELTTPDFMRFVRETSARLGITQDMLRRPLNVGFSGGEKKRNEILQMSLLAPRLCVMDETDSGLDIDALRVVAEGVNALRSPERSFVVITHYQRLLDYIVPDFVHVMSRGKIVALGRQGAGARARRARLRRLRRRGGVMAELPTRIRTRAEDALARHFASLAGDDPIYDIRATAFDAFMEKGLPHRRVEDWKYTDLRSLMSDAPGPAAPAKPDEAKTALARADIFAAIDRARIVFVNGHFVPPLSDMAGLEKDLEFASLGRFLLDGGAILDRSLDPAEAPVFALNSAFVRDGAVVRIRDGAKLSRPLELVHVFAGSEPGLQTLRHQVSVGAGAEGTILQSFAGPDGVAYHTNVVTEIHLGDGANIRWITAQEEGSEAIHLALLLPRIGARCALRSVRLRCGWAGLAHRAARRLRGGGFACEAARRHHRAPQAAHGHDARCRARRAALQRQGIFQGRDGRRVARRLPGQDHRRARRAEDRFQDDEPGAAPLRDGGVRRTSRSSRSSPTTWSAATAPPAAASTRTCSSSCARAASRRLRPSACWCRPSSPTRSS